MLLAQPTSAQYTSVDISSAVTAGPVIDAKNITSSPPKPAGNRKTEAGPGQFPVLRPPDTFIMADYDGTTLAGKVINDTSVDYIEDFNRTEGDKISLCTLGVTWANVSFDDATDLVTVHTGDGTLQFYVVGASSIQQSDFIF